VEDQKLRRRPQNWRLACQALVQDSLLVLTRPQVGLADQDALVESALARPLPPGPTAWPVPPEQEDADGDSGEEDPTATSDEAS
jgi:hypothetical protein